jgi:hypothetical protein
MFRRKMALEKAEGSLEKVAMGIHEREKEKINEVVSWLLGDAYAKISSQTQKLPNSPLLFS